MFLIDCYPDYREACMKVWYYSGKSFLKKERFSPVFYVHAVEKEKEHALCTYLENIPSISYTRHEVQSISFTKKAPVVKIVLNQYTVQELAAEIDRLGGYELYELFNVDISFPQRYFFERDSFPMMKIGEDSPFAVEYDVPPLKELFFDVAIQTKGIPSFSDPITGIVLRDTEDSFELDGTEERILTDFVKTVRVLDPDIIYSHGGDEFVIPYLLHRGHIHQVPVELGREPGWSGKEGKSYFSYGRIVYKPPQYVLKGRIHIDTKSSFHYKEGGLDGLIELSRMSRIPVQRLSRLSPGTAISSMQLYEAYRRKVLIPWRKQTPELFKTALQLVKADRGGHILEPQVGIHSHVGEVDFSSLYPNIINKFNISPETVLCTCCPDSERKVPVLEYNICEKRRGFIPDVVKPLIVKKALYKGNPHLKGRRTLLKWVLVTCFGYLGYRNARFGRIECHESVTAYAREILLTSMHTAEELGFEVLHGIVDSLWVKKEAPRSDFEELCTVISDTIGIPLELEGMYSWIVFLPSQAGIGSLTSYYGVIDGELKARGIELRRSDQPPLVKHMQEEMFVTLAQAESVPHFFRCLPDALEVVNTYVGAVLQGDVAPEDLVISIGISRRLEEYSVTNLSVAALKKLKKEGVERHPGQTVRYIIRDWKARNAAARVSIPELMEDTEYDKGKYAELLLRAGHHMLSPFISERRLREYCSNVNQLTLREYL
jgi:DNA polymerase elongation subunit (family B)